MATPFIQNRRYWSDEFRTIIQTLIRCHWIPATSSKAHDLQKLPKTLLFLIFGFLVSPNDIKSGDHVLAGPIDIKGFNRTGILSLLYDIRLDEF